MSTDNGNHPLSQQVELSSCEDIKQPIDNNLTAKQASQQNIGKVEIDNSCYTSRPLETDPWIYRIVVGCLTSTILICLLGAIGLSLKGGNERTPDLVTALGTGSLGAISGLLAPSPVKRKDS
ncbi:MAG: hypothetical protein DSM106950_39945 [Stigonema ocellatum SAG 48.90 = DSM 106950]|nr:hypothetical protein [Stigonema ocellatum SAG 48.90 = DSM 106950]